MTGLFCLRKNRPVILLLLFVLIFISAVNEVLLVPNSWYRWKIPPNVFYNVFSLFDIAVWMFIYYIIFKSRKLKLLVLSAGVFILTCSCAEIFFISSIDQLHVITLMWFSLISVLLSLLYFFLIYTKEIHRVGQDPVFWVCAAAICFHTMFFINLATIHQTAYWRLANAPLIFNILQSLASSSYYLFICTAFIISYCRYKATFKQDLL